MEKEIHTAEALAELDRAFKENWRLNVGKPGRQPNEEFDLYKLRRAVENKSLARYSLGRLWHNSSAKQPVIDPITHAKVMRSVPYKKPEDKKWSGSGSQLAT